MLFVMTLSVMAAHVYAPASVLKEGSWVKIRVAESGIHCLTYDELANAGLQPQNVRIYGYGGAMLSQDFKQTPIDDLPSVAFYMHKGSDGVFNQGDYILFYAQGPDSWEYSYGQFTHTRNPYSRYGYYFLTDNTGTQRLIEDAPAAGTATYTANTYTALMLHETDSVNLVDVSGKAGGGREFYGEQLSSVRPKLSIPFAFHDIVPNTNLNIVCKVAAAASSNSTFVMSVGTNQYTCTTERLVVSDFYTKATTNEGFDQFTLGASGTGTQTLTIQFSNSTMGSKGYLNYAEVSATCYMNMQGQEMYMANTDHYGENNATTYTLKQAAAGTEIWDISDRTNIVRLPSTGTNGTLQWTRSNATLPMMLAINPTTASGWKKPTIVGRIANQNLHELSNIDLMIIAPEDFLAAAQIVATAHEQTDGITTAIVTDQQVYNEFSSGTPDATAYRRLMKMLYDKAKNQSQRPRWLLLYGDGSFDNRRLLPTSGPSMLLTYQARNSEIETKAYATDDYFGFLDDNEGMSDISGRMDIGVGRLPVSSVAVAEAVAQKIARYLRNENPGKWHQQLVFVADDGDSNLHTKVTDLAAERTRVKNNAFIVNKIYIDAYPQEVNASGESSPLAKTRFTNLLNEGVLFFDYSGHGGYNNIASENMLSMRDCKQMTNANLGFWMLATCGFAHFDACDQSASEEAVTNADGGAIAVMSACRTVYASQNREINKNLCDTLFGHASDFSYRMTIGEACRIAKNMTGSDENKLSYILLGDPAIRLHYPTDYRVRTEQASDTLNALTTHRFTGWVENEQGDTAREFNGIVSISIMDKMQQVTTLDNDHPIEEDKVTYTYNDYPNTLYQGTTQVKNGHFAYTFMVPKDIRYNFGTGRITYHALDSLNGEGIGHFEDFVVGGSSSVAIVDTLGPDMHIYLNSPTFASGDKTNERPHFYADIYDEHGINTAGSGIGHDLLMTVDDDPEKMYILNDYFSSGNDYRSGLVSYRMEEQEEGRHTLTFRAWDLMNNSATASLSFEVVKGMQPTMYSVMTYPNPVRVSETMHFVVDYDQPDELLEMNAYVYAPSGELVYTTSRKGTEQHTVSVDDAHLTPGIYVYRICLTTTAGVMTSKAGKLIVIEN